MRGRDDKWIMYVVPERIAHVRRDQQGFTLPEVLTTIAILGILIAIAIIIWLGILEQRRVDAAANQFASDLRLAHTRASNQLTDWRVAFMPDGSPVVACSSSDYCLFRLDRPFEDGEPTPSITAGTLTPRGLPEGTKILSVTFGADCSAGGTTAVVGPSSCGSTRTLEFNPNGTVRTLRPGQSGTVRISSTDGDPYRDVVFLSATSRIRID